MKHLSILLLFLLAAAAGWLLNADFVRADSHHTHFVATTGNDQSGTNDCSVEVSPCATIGRAITAAPADSVIHIAAGTYTEHSLTISKNLTLDGDGVGTTTIDGNDGGRIFNITAGTVTIEDLTVTDGTVAGATDGGGIRNQATLTLNEVAVTFNAAGRHGGGIWNTAGGQLFVSSSTISNNGTGQAAAGIWNDGGTSSTTLTNVTISNNTAGSSGGGLYNNQGRVVMTGGTISGNRSTAGAVRGGGIFHDGAAMTLTNVVVTGNHANQFGGGITVTTNRTLTMTGGEISNNTASSSVGGLWVTGAGTATLTNVNVTGNVTVGSGGGLYSDGSTITMRGGSIVNNSATVNGGGVFADSRTTGTVTIGGMNLDDRVTITGNTATGQGDAVFRNSGTVTMEGNWWGHLRGPQHTTNVNSGSGGEAVGTVDFSPWCANSGCSNYHELPAALAFGVQPSNAGVGTTISPSPTVRAIGALNYLAINAANTISLTLSGGSTSVLGGTASRAASDGIATFTDLVINTIGSGYQLTAAATGLTSTTSSTFNIAPNPLVITTATLPDGTIGVPYTRTLAATGGVTPYTWSVASGALPTGLSLNASTGEISGDATATSTFTFTVRVEDNESVFDEQALSITIVIPAVLTFELPEITEGVAYNQTITAGGGTPPYAWSITSGALPDGLSLDDATGAITGTPTVPGTYDFTIEVEDSLSGTDDQELTIVVNAEPEITSLALPDGTEDSAYLQALGASGGTAPLVWSLASGSLPSGLSLNASTGAITGTPTTNGDFSFTVRVTDAHGVIDEQDLSVAIAAAPVSQEKEEDEDSDGSRSGSSVRGRVRNLLEMGKTEAADALRREWAHLFPGVSSNSAPGTSTPSSPSLKTCSGYTFIRNLHLGDTGEDVRMLQRTLNCLGFTLADSGPGSPGEETSLFRDRTHDAVSRFQEAYAADILAPLHLTHGTGYFAELSRKKMGEMVGDVGNQ